MNLADNPVSMPAWASALAGLAALAVAIGIGRFAFTPILPMMQEDFGLSVSEAGWLASANYTGYLVGALSAIGLRLQSTVAIRAGLLVIGLSTLAMGLDHPFMLSLVLLTMSGIASAWVLVFVSNWALERLALLGRSKLSGTVYAGVGTGIVIAGGACLVLMSLHARSGDAWLSLGVISIAVTVMIWPLLKASPSRDPVSAPTASGIWSAEYRRRRGHFDSLRGAVGAVPVSPVRLDRRSSRHGARSGDSALPAGTLGNHDGGTARGRHVHGDHHGGHAGGAKGGGALRARAHGGNDFGVCARPDSGSGDRKFSGSVNRGFRAGIGPCRFNARPECHFTAAKGERA